MVRGGAGIFRLAAIDLDGTLLRSDGTIGDRTKRAVRETRLDIVLVTARGPLTMRAIAEELGVAGAAICSSRRRSRRSASLRFPARGCARSRAHPLPASRFGPRPRMSGAATSRRFSKGTPPHGTRVADVVELLADPATKLILRHAEHDTAAIQELAREIAGDGLTVVASGSEAVEVTAAGVNKATAVAELGVPPEQIVAFGDYPNDIPLLSWAGLGVAMGNAHAEVLAVADEVTATNDEDGVALILERLAG